MAFALQNDDFCINNDEFCIKNAEFCSKNDGFCIKNDGFCIKNDAFCMNDKALDVFLADVLPRGSKVGLDPLTATFVQGGQWKDVLEVRIPFLKTLSCSVGIVNDKLRG